jgi:hypothetical protein
MLLTGSDRAWKHEFYESRGFDREAKTGFTLDLREGGDPDDSETTDGGDRTGQESR